MRRLLDRTHIFLFQSWKDFQVICIQSNSLDLKWKEFKAGNLQSDFNCRAYNSFSFLDTKPMSCHRLKCSQFPLCWNLWVFLRLSRFFSWYQSMELVPGTADSHRQFHMEQNPSILGKDSLILFLLDPFCNHPMCNQHIPSCYLMLHLWYDSHKKVTCILWSTWHKPDLKSIFSIFYLQSWSTRPVNNWNRSFCHSCRGLSLDI